METLNSTEPHYIRCVKPNNVLKPAIFENVKVIQQLRCGVSAVRTFHIIEARQPRFSVIELTSLFLP